MSRICPHRALTAFSCTGENATTMHTPDAPIKLCVRFTVLAALAALSCSDTGPGGEQRCSPAQSCPAGQVCITGINFCVVAEGCVQGEVCGPICTNTHNDPKNCGDCGILCSGATPFCADKTCVSACPSGLIACGDACVNLARDVRDCGACGHTCGLLQACESGVCVDACNAPLADCGGICIDPAADTENCGACGHICQSSAPYCAQGQCVASCPTSLVTCEHSCVDLAVDPWNCGECKHRCDPGQICQSGSCR
jgi:Stigma-specific protein, Stig1